MKIDPPNLNRTESHNLMVSIIVPRPIAWVSTISKDGILNLAPFSMYTAGAGGVIFGTSWRRDLEKKDAPLEKKDTLSNIEDTKEFVINIVNETLAKAMNVTAAPYPPDVDEFKEAKLTPVKADLVKAPMVGESPINLECRLKQIIESGEGDRRGSLIMGDLLRVHVRDELIVNGEIDMSRLKAIARLGGEWYCRTTDLFTMPRPPD